MSWDWRAKKGPILTMGRGAHFAWGYGVCLTAALIFKPFVVSLILVLVPVLAWLSEATSFITWKTGDHPFGDWIDYAAYLFAVAVAIVFLVCVGVLK